MFVDASAIIALSVPWDEHHKPATSLFASFGTDDLLLTSTDVFDETMTRIRRKAGHASAVAAGKLVRSSTIFRQVPVEAEDREAAWDLFCKRSDLRLSHTDCTTSVLMDRLGLRRIFTFDADFAALGYDVVPRLPRRK